jgi:cullin 3
MQAFQTFINTNARAPEFLSLYIDEHLKKGTKAVSATHLALDATADN